MHVLLDLEAMRFVYAHPSRLVLGNLGHIELCHTSTRIFEHDTFESFNSLTDLELLLLYRNTTGLDHMQGTRRDVIAMLVHLAERLPVADVVPYEVQAQANTLQHNELGHYRYVKGSSTPQELDDPWEGLYPQAVPSGPVAALPASATAQAAPTPAPKPARAPSAPRAEGGIKGTVWRVADEMWTAAGSPKDVKVVLALRKQIMNVLVDAHGANRNTSSTELGNWQKARLV